MTLGKSQYPNNLFIGDSQLTMQSIEIEPTLKILGVTLDRDLSFKPHVAIMLKKAYAKIAAPRLPAVTKSSTTLISTIFVLAWIMLIYRVPQCMNCTYKTKPLDNAILELWFSGLAIMIYEPLYHALQIW